MLVSNLTFSIDKISEVAAFALEPGLGAQSDPCAKTTTSEISESYVSDFAIRS